MADNKPLVSIGVPVYNGGQYIGQTLDSLLNQDYSNLELIISDNASTDTTPQICSEYAAKDQRVRYSRNLINTGAHKNFAHVFSLSKGEYFMWASCQDLWEKGFISRAIELLRQNSTAVMCYPQADWINEDGNRIEVMQKGPDTRGLNQAQRCHKVLWKLPYGYPIHGLIRTKALRQTNIFGPTIGADLILLFELSLMGEFIYVPEVLLHIRRMPDFCLWDKYIEKCLNKQVKGLPRRLLFFHMVIEHQRAVVRHIHNMFLKTGLIVYVAISVLLKHRRILYHLTILK